MNTVLNYETHTHTERERERETERERERERFMNHKRIFAAKVVCACFVMVRLVSMVAFLITINQE